MTEPRRSEDPAVQFRSPGLSPASLPIRELQIRIPCRRKTADHVLDNVRRGLADAESEAREPLLIFEELGQLEDSVATLIKGLCRLLLGYPHSVTFWESSGYTEAFLS